MDFTGLIGILPLLLIAAVLMGVVVAVVSGKSILKTVTLCTVGIVLIGSIMVPIINDVNWSYDEDTGWKYDDYRQYEATEATGAFEIVTIGGKTYVHANDIGEGTYTINGVTTTETVEIADLDVVLILGQSNAAYRSTSDPSTAAPIPKIGKAYYYGDENGAIFTSHTDVKNGNYSFTGYQIYDMIDSDGETRLGNIEAPFAATYDGGKVLTINGAVSGSSTANWTDGGYCYNYAQSCITTALGLIDTTKFTIKSLATLWIQGETDAFMTVSDYVSNVYSLYSDLNSGDFADGYHFDKFLMSLTRNGYNAATAQKQLASEYNGIYLATEVAEGFTIDNGKMLADDLHYSQKGDNQLGVAFGKYLNRLT